jgi:hypothetical protein
MLVSGRNNEWWMSAGEKRWAVPTLRLDRVQLETPVMMHVTREIRRRQPVNRCGRWLVVAGLLLGVVGLSASRAFGQPPEAARRVDAAAVAVPDVVTLIPIDGKPVTGRVIECDDRGLRLDGVASPWSRVTALRWNRAASPPLSVPVLFVAPRDRLHLAPRSGNETHLVCEWTDLPALGTIAVPLETVRGGVIQSKPPLDRARRAILAGRIPTDTLWLSNGDQLTGEFTGLERGVWRFGAADNSPSAPAESVVAFGMGADLVIEPESPKVRFAVLLADGSRLMVGPPRIASGQIEVISPALGPLKVPLALVAEVRPLDASAIYLSDLETLVYRPTPYLTRVWPLARDESVTGDDLRLGDELIVKGLGVHAPAEIDVPLPKPFRRFEMRCGLAPSAGQYGSARIELLVDGVVRHQTGELTALTQPEEITLPLEQAQTLTIRIFSSRRANVRDHVVLGNARLVK